MNSLFPFQVLPMFCHHTVAFARSATLAWPMRRRRLSSHLSCLTRSPSVRIQIQRTGDPLSESTNISTTIEPPRPARRERQREEERRASSEMADMRVRSLSLSRSLLQTRPTDRVKRRRRRPDDGRNAVPRYSSLLLAWSDADSSADRVFARHPCLQSILTQPERTRTCTSATSCLRGRG